MLNLADQWARIGVGDRIVQSSAGVAKGPVA
jgi:hypothetical protein